MEMGREDEIEDISVSPPTMGSMQIAGGNGFGHNIEFMSQAYLRNRSSEIDIGDASCPTIDRPLPIFLKFEDVQYKVRNISTSQSNPVKAVVSKVASQQDTDQENYKHILKGITGSIGPGEILALMGPSGSGKTTLLKIIGGRLQENVKGIITYNGVPYNPGVKRRIGFVTQDDVLFPQLTVEETLVFAAYLRLPKSMSKKQKYDRVEIIINELGLERCRHTRIGGGLVKGISGGERKRTSIGYEILVDPSFLLLDEPTSGLDSTSANRLLQILQGLAEAGRTLITTIHQPSSRMFHMFDKILLIAEGYPVYYGKAREAMDYFSSLGFIPEIPMNPAEFLLDLATGQVNDISIPEDAKKSSSNLPSEKAVIEGPQFMFEFLSAYPASDLRSSWPLSPSLYNGSIEVTFYPDMPSQAPFLDLVAQYLQMKYKTELEPKEKEVDHQSRKMPEQLQLAIQVKKDWTMSWWEQFMILFKRTFRERWRDYFDKLRLVQAIGVAVLLGLLWWKSKNATEAQLRDQVGLMFYICIFWTSSSIFGAVYVFPFEKLYLVKERKADMYRLSVYYVCSTLSDMMANVLYPTVFMAIVYFMAGFKRTVMCFFLTLFATLLIAVTSQGAGELFGAAVLSIKRAGMIASLVLMLFLLTGGYYVQILIFKLQRTMLFTSSDKKRFKGLNPAEDSILLLYISILRWYLELTNRLNSRTRKQDFRIKFYLDKISMKPPLDQLGILGKTNRTDIIEEILRWVKESLVQHIPKFMKWLKYISFMYYGFRLLLKVQYSGDQLYECESKGGCRSLQSSPSFDTVNLNGGLKEVWVLLAMALAYRLCAYVCLRRRINSFQV
ncbi:ABC transporter G member 26 [Ancistrocladus abbreviatus]